MKNLLKDFKVTSYLRLIFCKKRIIKQKVYAEKTIWNNLREFLQALSLQKQLTLDYLNSN